MNEENEKLVQFANNYFRAMQRRSHDFQTQLAAGKDRVVNFLKPNDPIQFVLRGLMLCEEKAREIVVTHLPDCMPDRDNLQGQLDLLQKNDLLEKSEIPPYKKLNRLRNHFAHDPEYELTSKVARELWNTLNLEQRKQIIKKFDIDSSTAKEKPGLLVKTVILRLYMHLESILVEKDLRAGVESLTDQ